MTSITYRGRWQLAVIRKVSDWPHRIVITGSVSGTVAGEVGMSTLVAGDLWHLSIEHHDGRGWRPSRYVAARPLQQERGRATQLIVSKDRYWSGDSDPNDLVLRLTNLGPTFETLTQPYAVDGALRPVAGGVGGNQAEYLAVEIRNTGYRAFDYDTVLDITVAGRQALADHGVLVQDSWTPAALQATGQEEFGSGISVPPLEVGDEATVYFQIDASRSRAGTPTVEFVLLDGDAPAGRVGSSRRGLSVVLVTDAHELPPARSRRDVRSDVVRPRTESQPPTPVRHSAQIVPAVASESAPRTDTSAPETGRTQQATETAG